MSAIDKKLTIVGDGCVGKTLLIETYLNQRCPLAFAAIPTVFECYVTEFELDNQHIRLRIQDTSGVYDYDRLRPLCYFNPATDVVLISYSISQPYTLESVYDKWIDEVRSHMPKVPVILVGNQMDVRNDPKDSNWVTFEAANEVAKKIGAYAYLECSARNNEGVQEVFREAARAAISYECDVRKSKGKLQCVLA